ncbi:MAG: serine acetyltransferase [Saprospiraceae bacterium]
MYSKHKACPGYPPLDQVRKFINDILGLMYPIRTNYKVKNEEDIKVYFDNTKLTLRDLVRNSCSDDKLSSIVDDFYKSLPVIYTIINTDIDAMFEGDPAASCKEEVIRSYPGFFAIACYRIAHKMYQLKIEILPRTITEIAHQITGIDIHPGATIDSHFCIDHGTGVVIGETAKIGKYVKLYQGVTLGALSVRKEDASSKRHPTLEDNVVVYAGATILGGKTIIGKNSIVGGNVWLPKSIPANSKIYYKAAMHNVDTKQMDTFVYSNSEKKD